MALNIYGNIITSTDITDVGVFKTEINREGLACYLDSMNLNSYPRSGTVWYDLTGNGNNGTLTTMNSPSAGNTSGFDTTTGYMMFDRHVGAADGTANNVVTFSSSATLLDCLSQNGMSMEMWLKITTPVCTAMSKLVGSWEIYYCSGLVHYTEGSAVATLAGTINSSTYTNFHHLTITHDGINRRIYVNGVHNATDISIPAGQSFGSMGLGAYPTGIYAFIGSIPIYRVYSRALNSYEIAENFQSERGRFGI